MAGDGSPQAQLVKEEMMFWFRQELRRRDNANNELQLKHESELRDLKLQYENDLREQKLKIQSANEVTLEFLKRQYSAQLAAESSKFKALEIRLAETEEERNQAKTELSKWIVTRLDSAMQTELSIANQCEAMIQTETDDYIQSLEQAMASLKETIKSLTNSELQYPDEVAKLSKTVTDRESEIEFLHDLLLREKDESEHQIEHATSDHKFEVETLTKRHEAILGIQNLHLSDAVKERDNALARNTHLESELSLVSQKLALELQSRALSDAHAREQHDNELAQVKRRHDELMQNSNQKIVVLQSELSMVREELNQSRLECVSKSKKEQQYLLQLQEARTRTEKQLLEQSFELNDLQTTIQKQLRRAAQLCALLKQSGIELSDHEGSGEQQTETKSKELGLRKSKQPQKQTKPSYIDIKHKEKAAVKPKQIKPRANPMRT